VAEGGRGRGLKNMKGRGMGARPARSPHPPAGRTNLDLALPRQQKTIFCKPKRHSPRTHERVACAVATAAMSNDDPHAVKGTSNPVAMNFPQFGSKVPLAEPS